MRRMGLATGAAQRSGHGVLEPAVAGKGGSGDQGAALRAVGERGEGAVAAAA